MWHWINYIWIQYFWSSDKGNGPEALTQIAIGFVLAALFWPPLRKFLKRKEEALHAKMDHIIKHHPDIPPMPEAK